MAIMAVTAGIAAALHNAGVGTETSLTPSEVSRYEAFLSMLKETKSLNVALHNLGVVVNQTQSEHGVVPWGGINSAPFDYCMIRARSGLDTIRDADSISLTSSYNLGKLTGCLEDTLGKVPAEIKEDEKTQGKLQTAAVSFGGLALLLWIASAAAARRKPEEPDADGPGMQP